jgi:hypothetical protein
VSLDQRQECGWLWKGSDGSEGKQIAVSVVAIGDSLYRVAEYAVVLSRGIEEVFL